MRAGTDREPRKNDSSNTLLLLILAGVGGCVCLAVAVCIGVAIVARDVARKQADFEVPIPLPPAAAESAEQKRADVVAGLSGAPLTPEQIPDQVTQLLDSLVEATGDDDLESFRNLFDPSRMFEEMKRSGVIQALRPSEEAQGPTWVRNSLGIPYLWAAYHVTALTPIPGTSDLIAYVVFEDADGDFDEARLWIKTAPVYRFYDFERVQFGMRESRDFALFYRDGDEARLRNYSTHMTLVNGADTPFATGHPEQAETTLRNAESAVPSMPLEFQDRARLTIAYAWCRHARYVPALALLKTMTHPDAAPGAHYCEALCYQALQRPGRALNAIKRFQATAGSTPNFHHPYATALLDLGRHTESVDSWKARMTYKPHDAMALQSLAESLPADRKTELVEYLDRQDDPVAGAASVLNAVRYRGDLVGASTLVAFLERRAPGSVQHTWARGTYAEMMGRHEEAADHYLRALKEATDESTRTDYLHNYLDEMIQLKKFVEAYEAAPDPVAVFRYFASGDEDDEGALDRKDLRQVLDVHRKKLPDEPWGQLWSAILLDEDGKEEEALAILTSLWMRVGGDSKTTRGEMEEQDSDDEADYGSLRSWVESHLQSTLIDLGRIDEAYERFGAGPQGFTSLAGSMRWRDKPADLKRLVELHRAAQPADPWLAFYEALVAQKEDHIEDAVRILSRLAAEVGDPARPTVYGAPQAARWELLGMVRQGKLPPGIDVSDDLRRDSFAALANEAIENEDWKRLDELFAQQRRLAPDDPLLPQTEARGLWERKNYAELAARFGEIPSATVQISSYGDSQSAFVTRSLLRLRRSQDALNYARRVDDAGFDARPLILAHAADGNVAAIEELFGTLSRNSYLISSSYWDQDSGPVLWSADFARIRTQFPPQLPYAGVHDEIALLRSEPWEPGEELRETLSQAFGGADVGPLGPGRWDRRTRSWLVRRDGQSWVVSSGSDRYHGEKDPEYAPTPAPVKDLLSNHRGWISVGELRVYSENSAGRASLGAAVASLMDERCLALSAPRYSRVVAASDEVRNALKTVGIEKSVFQTGHRHSLHRSSWDAPDDETAVAEVPGLEAAPNETEIPDESETIEIGEFRSAFELKGGDQFEVEVRLSVGPSDERLWLAVDRLVPARYGPPAFVGRLKTGSRAIPHLAAGEPISVSGYQVTNWSYLAPEGTKAARPRK